MQATARAFRLAPGDRVLVSAAPPFDATLAQLLAPVVTGAALSFPDAQPWTPEQILNAVVRRGITVLHRSPDEWAALAADEAACAGVRASVRLGVHGGPSVPRAVLRAWHRGGGTAPLVPVVHPEGAASADSILAPMSPVIA